MSDPSFESMDPGEDGWCDWVHPLPGYLMKCCDCGLVHEVEFAIGEASASTTEFNEGENAEAVVIFRARRQEP